MRKKVLCVFVSLILLFNCFPVALAVGPEGVENTQSSQYLSSYTVALIALSNGKMAVEMDVNATGYMTQVGVQELYIEQKINGVWQEFDTVYGAAHSDFFEYNDYTYLGEYFFYGVNGRQYRVTMTAFARNSSGSDTGDVMSVTATCHNP